MANLSKIKREKMLDYLEKLKEINTDDESSWKTVYSRFCKWRDDDMLFNIFHALNAEADYENLSIDFTSVKAHQHSAGAKKGL